MVTSASSLKPELEIRAVSKTLAPRQLRFADEYLLDLNATQAAIRSGYSARTAYSQGHRLLKNVEVAAHIVQAAKLRSERTQISQDRVLAELAAIAFSDIATFWETDSTTGRLRLKAIPEWPEQVCRAVASLKARRCVATAPAAKTSESFDGYEVIEVRFWNKPECLKLLGLHLGMFSFSAEIPTDVRREKQLFRFGGQLLEI